GLKKEYHSIRQTDTETSTEFMQRFLRLAGFLRVAAGTAEEQAKNFQWGLRRDDDDVERPDKRQKSGDRHQPTSQQSSHRNHGYNNDRHGSDRQGGGDNHLSSNNNYSGNNNRLNFKSIWSSSTQKHDPNITVSSSPGVPLRATLTRSALRVDADTQESVVELLVSVSSVVKLAICRRIARRTSLRVHLVRLIRNQVHRVVFSPSLKIMLLRPQVP
nr:zinc finger, CCHC-type, retrotransposon Gag domain protein [Tanacetum cinerariifolium]